MKNWEETAAIASVTNMHDKCKINALVVERAIRKEFRLNHSDVSLCPHQPVQFLIKFEHKARCAEVLKRACFTAEGVHVQIKQWRAFACVFRCRARLRSLLMSLTPSLRLRQRPFTRSCTRALTA